MRLLFYGFYYILFNTHIIFITINLLYNENILQNKLQLHITRRSATIVLMWIFVIFVSRLDKPLNSQIWMEFKYKRICRLSLVWLGL